MKYLAIPLLLLTFLTATARSADESYPLRDAVECTPRGGLPHFRKKVEAGESVKIGYLGGSITAAAGWRVQSREWLAKTYPDATFEEIHAAIGGTGSDLGVFRVYNDALQHKPDLLFVEFAVNDGGAAPERIHKAMEGIVRQTWKNNPETDICFVYTLSAHMLDDLNEGKMPRAASAMEALADHYQIPSIHFGVKVASLVKSGDLVFKADKPEDLTAKPLVFSTDGVHPLTETGHKIYSETIARNWPALWEATPEEARFPKTPYRDDNWEEAKQIAITEEMLEGDWEELGPDDSIAKRFSKNMPQMFRAKSPGATLKFTLNGTTASVFDLVGPSGGQIEIKVDDKDPVFVKRIDGYCTYHRMSKTAILTEAENTTHEISATLTGEDLDKREILFEKNREYFDKNPDKYSINDWYISSLLIIGDIAE
ncbi:MAG: SGNH/GDSL hydrolase family protein [Verrucomicrobiales bacterium]|nr:SGNH/GDSL hydrolase family protein [Verrucomicrobiales bacterium]